MSVVERKQSKKWWLIFSLATVFLWGMLAHAYRFLNGNFSHDSLVELNGAIFGNTHKIALGRFLVPLYRDILRGDLTLPWLIGVLSILWIGLSLFLILQILEIKDTKVAFLAAGILTANVSVSATAATYLHDLDCYMFAMLCAVAAVWLWQKRAWGWLLGGALLAASMGIYQGFLFVAVTLAMIRCILWLIEGETCKSVLTRGIKAIAMILLGGIAYWLALKLVEPVFGVALYSGDYNSLDKMDGITLETLPLLIFRTYKYCIYRIWNAPSTYPAILTKLFTIGLILTGLITLVQGMKKLGWKEKGLLFLLVALLPLGAFGINILTVGQTHDLMVYAIWLLWLLPLVLSDRVWLPGETPVVFVGLPQIQNSEVLGFGAYQSITGMESPDVLVYPNRRRFQTYFDYILNTPLLLAEESEWEQIVASEQTAQMPCYPSQGCMEMRDGILVVRMGEIFIE